MTNVENIIILFQSPVRGRNTTDFQIRNAALAHFCVAMVDRLIKCDCTISDTLLMFIPPKIMSIYHFSLRSRESGQFLESYAVPTKKITKYASCSYHSL